MNISSHMICFLNFGCCLLLWLNNYHNHNQFNYIVVQSLHGYGFNDHMEGIPPYFVRRWAPKVKAALKPVQTSLEW